MRVLHVIARVNLDGAARWMETLTADQSASGQEVLLATGQVQGDEVEDPGAATMPLIRLDRLGRSVSPWDDLEALRELRDLIGDLRPAVVNTHTAKAGLGVALPHSPWDAADQLLCTRSAGTCSGLLLPPRRARHLAGN